MKLVTWSKWPPRPSMVKPLQNLLLLNRWTDFHETWYVASGTQAHYSLFSLLKWWPLIDFDLFNVKVKFGTCNLGFSIGKIENSVFFINYWSLWPESLEMHTTYWANEVKEGQCHFLTLAPGYLHDFLRNYWTILNHILYVSFHVQGNDNPRTWCWSHDQYGLRAHVW